MTCAASVGSAASPDQCSRERAESHFILKQGGQAKINVENNSNECIAEKKETAETPSSKLFTWPWQPLHRPLPLHASRGHRRDGHLIAPFVVW